MTHEQMQAVETSFLRRMQVQGVKKGSKQFFNAQTEFFCGAMAALVSLIPDELPDAEKNKLLGEAMPPRWVFGLMRPKGIEFDEPKPVANA